MSKSFNSFIGEARSKDVVDLINMTRGRLMELKAERKAHSMSWRGELVPYIGEYILDVTLGKNNLSNDNQQ